jgi:hypothetical protein
MQTNKLTGAALDWAVHYAIHGTCEGYSPHEYSNDWAQGGPIIERERLCVMPYNNSWMCATNGNHLQSHSMQGDTPLEAAMRCYVASKLGDTVDIPKELHP